MKLDIGASRVRIFAGGRKIGDWEGKVGVEEWNHFVREVAVALTVLTEQGWQWIDTNWDGTFDCLAGPGDQRIRLRLCDECAEFTLWYGEKLEYSITHNAVVVAENIHASFVRWMGLP